MSKPITSPGILLFLSFFGLPFLAAGLFMTWLYLSSVNDWWAARSWEEIPCRITSVSLDSSRGSDSTTYKVGATYNYTYRGEKHTGDKVSTSSGGDNIGSFQRDKFRELSSFARKVEKNGKVTKRRKRAKPYRCFVNPEEPSEAILDRSLRWPILAFYSAFALTFPAVGFFLVFSLLFFRSPKVLPAQANIPESKSPLVLCLSIYTAWAALIITPMLFAVYSAGIFREDKTSLALLILPIVLLVLVYTIFRGIRRRKLIGKTSLALEVAPSQIGAPLTGDIICRKFPKLFQDPQLTLVCSKTTTEKHGGKTRYINERIWSDTQTVPTIDIRKDIGSCKIPFSFTIPYDAPPTGKEGDAEHFWTVEMEVPGTGVKTKYTIPVVADPNPPRPTSSEPLGTISVAGDASPVSMAAVAQKNLPDMMNTANLVTEFSPSGEIRSITCPRSNHRQVTLFLLAFNTLWTAASVFLIVQEAPLIFRT